MRDYGILVLFRNMGVNPPAESWNYMAKRPKTPNLWLFKDRHHLVDQTMTSFRCGALHRQDAIKAKNFKTVFCTYMKHFLRSSLYQDHIINFL